MSGEPGAGELVAPGAAPAFPLMRDLVARAYAFLEGQAVGARFNYPLLSATIGVDAQDTRGRAAVLRAGRKLLRERNTLMLNVRGYGYELVAANAHAKEAARQYAHADTRIKRGVAAATHCNYRELTDQERTEVLTQQTRGALLLGINRRLGRMKALPAKAEVQLPSGAELVRLFEKRG